MPAAFSCLTLSHAYSSLVVGSAIPMHWHIRSLSFSPNNGLTRSSCANAFWVSSPSLVKLPIAVSVGLQYLASQFAAKFVECKTPHAPFFLYISTSSSVGGLSQNVCVSPSTPARSMESVSSRDVAWATATKP